MESTPSQDVSYALARFKQKPVPQGVAVREVEKLQQLTQGQEATLAAPTPAGASRMTGLRAEPLSQAMARPKPKPVPFEPAPPVVDEAVTPRTELLLHSVASACGWSVLAAFALWMMLLVADLARNMPTSTGVETIWLAPSLCPSADPGFNRFVGYLDARVGEPHACPSGKVRPASQQFVLPSSLPWSSPGHNASLAVFRAEADSITLSFSLADANGKWLLKESRLQLGPPPTPRTPAPTARQLLVSAPPPESATVTPTDPTSARGAPVAAHVAGGVRGPLARRLLLDGEGGLQSHKAGLLTFAPRHPHTGIAYPAGTATAYGRTVRSHLGRRTSPAPAKRQLSPARAH